MDHEMWVLNMQKAQSGHHSEYYAVFERAFGATVRDYNRSAFFTRSPVLVPMIELSLFHYLALCLIRSVTGRYTAGLLFRPLPAIYGTSWRLKMKRWALKLVRRLPRVATLTIMPFSVEPRFAEIAHDWIYDLQFWDLHVPTPLADGRAPGDLAAQIREAAGDRAVCCAIGRQDADKGFDLFAQSYARSEELRQRMLFAFGGSVSPSVADPHEAFEKAGGVGKARFINNDELLDLYACADVIWACYGANYDQASGIFGRAMQMGLPVVVRHQSLLHRFCQLEGLPHIPFDSTMDPAVLCDVPPRQDAGAAAERSRQMGFESIKKLRGLLNVHLSAEQTQAI